MPTLKPIFEGLEKEKYESIKKEIIDQFDEVMRHPDPELWEHLIIIARKK